MIRLTTATLGLLIIGQFINCNKIEKLTDKVDHQTIITQDEEGVSPKVEESLEAKDFTAFFLDEKDVHGFESCGFEAYNSDLRLPLSMVEEFDLIHLDAEKEYSNLIFSNMNDAYFLPIAKQKMGETDILIYGIAYDKNDLYIEENRVVLYQENKIFKNILFSRSISDDGESTLCRKLLLFPNRIELAMMESENVDHLGIPNIETYYFDTAIPSEK